MIRTRGIIVALLITGALSSGQALAQAPAAAEALAKVLGAAGAGELISKIFDKLTKDKTPEEKARQPLRNFYESLILLGNARADLYQAILYRLSDPEADKKDYSHLESNKWPQSYIRVREAAHDAGRALGHLEWSLRIIQVDLDCQDPKLMAYLHQYRTSGQAGELKILGVDPTNLEQMKSLKKEMEKNDKVLDAALDQLRILTKKYYPKIGDLMQ